VFVDGWSDTAWNDCGPHFRWGTGAIWDNVTMNAASGSDIEAENYGNEGTSHGWAGANEVDWNCTATGGFVVRNPPTARNWLIGGSGAIQDDTAAIPYPAPAGTYDAVGTNVFPNSLYYAQLQDRLAAPNLQTREYWLGVIDAFSNTVAGGEAVYLDTTWSNAVNAIAGGQPLDGFDEVTNNHWIPFTFKFSLSATDRVIAATLVLAMRASNSAAADTLYLGSTTNSFSFTSLGWQNVGAGTNTTVRVLDLTSQLITLTNGQLNVAAGGDLGIDWAMLELQVAPVQTLVTNFIPVTADTFVRGGSYATNNYGTNVTLDVKLDSSASNTRQAYLRWNLAGYSPAVLQAKLRLTPVFVGTNGLEHGLTLATSNNWKAHLINWSNQPGGGKRFVTWIPPTNNFVEVVVTPQVQNVLSSDGQLSFQIYSLNNLGGSGLASYASSQDPNPANWPQLLLLYSNALPNISSIADQSIPAGTNTGALSLTISDPVSPANSLTLGALSSNTNLVPNTNIIFGGSSSNRTVTVTPVAGQSGSALITLVVTNLAGLTAGSQFTLTVTNTAKTNAMPTITSFANASIPVNSSTGPIPFMVADSFYDPSLLTVGASATNNTLVPSSGFLFGGSSGSRTLTVTPALMQTGSALIIVTVTNPAGATATALFTLTVTNGSGNIRASGTWAVDASGDWSNPLNWNSGIVATGADMTATFAIDITANRFVNNDAPRSIGDLIFSDANSNSDAGWFVTNSPLTLQVSSGTPVISLTNVTCTINSVINGSQGLVSQGNGTLVLGGANLYSGSTTLASGVLRAVSSNAFGSNANGTTIGNDPTARLELAGGITLAGSLTVSCKGAANGNVPAVRNFSDTNTLDGFITLTTGGSYWTFESAGGELIVAGTTTNSTTTNIRTVWLRGTAVGDWRSAIGDSAGGLGSAIRKDDAGTWILSGTNSYTGGTVISNGTLLVNGVVAGTNLIVAGGTLGGTGLIKAAVIVNSGGTLAPSSGVGKLTLSNNLTFAAGSTASFELSAQASTNDLIRGISNVVYAGTLLLTNLGGTLADGQTFKLFSATTFTGNFTNLSPASPGANLSWSFNPTNGTLNIAALPPPKFTSIAFSAANGITFSGIGPTNQSYRVLAATNLSLPLANWLVLATNTFVGGTFNFTDSQSTNLTQRFYQLATP